MSLPLEQFYTVRKTFIERDEDIREPCLYHGRTFSVSKSCPPRLDSPTTLYVEFIPHQPSGAQELFADALCNLPGVIKHKDGRFAVILLPRNNQPSGRKSLYAIKVTFNNSARADGALEFLKSHFAFLQQGESSKSYYIEEKRKLQSNYSHHELCEVTFVVKDLITEKGKFVPGCLLSHQIGAGPYKVCTVSVRKDDGRQISDLAKDMAKWRWHCGDHYACNGLYFCSKRGTHPRWLQLNEMSALATDLKHGAHAVLVLYDQAVSNLDANEYDETLDQGLNIRVV